MSDDQVDRLKQLVELLATDPEVSEEDLADLKTALPWADTATLKWLVLELHQAARRATLAFDSKFIPQKRALTWSDAIHLEKEFRRALSVAVIEVVKWIEADVNEDQLIPFEDRWELPHPEPAPPTDTDKNEPAE